MQPVCLHSLPALGRVPAEDGLIDLECLKCSEILANSAAFTIVTQSTPGPKALFSPCQSTRTHDLVSQAHVDGAMIMFEVLC